MKRDGNLRVDGFDDVRDGVDAGAERVQDLALSEHPMVEILLYLRRRVLDDRAVSGVDAPHAQTLHAPKRIEILTEISVLVWDHRRRAVQDEIAREERL